MRVSDLEVLVSRGSSPTRSVRTGMPQRAARDDGLPPELACGVYADLRRIAQSLLAHERLDHTLSATALVHEAYLRLIDQNQAQWADKSHFRAMATTMMDRVLIDHARSRARKKRGGGQCRLSRVDEEPIVASEPDTTLDLVADALEKLRALDERQFFIVHLRIYGGFSTQETARALGLSLRTVEREWAMAKAWLKREIKQGELQ